MVGVLARVVDCRRVRDAFLVLFGGLAVLVLIVALITFITIINIITIVNVIVAAPLLFPLGRTDDIWCCRDRCRCSYDPRYRWRRRWTEGFRFALFTPLALHLGLLGVKGSYFVLVAPAGDVRLHEHLVHAEDLFSERLVRQQHRRLVAHAVVAQLVALADQPLDDASPARRLQADDEECRARAILAQHLGDLERVARGRVVNGERDNFGVLHRHLPQDLRVEVCLEKGD